MRAARHAAPPRAARAYVCTRTCVHAQTTAPLCVRSYCPICMTAHRANEDQMIQCDKCAYWVHAECDGIDKAAFEALYAEVQQQAQTQRPSLMAAT